MQGIASSLPRRPDRAGQQVRDLVALARESRSGTLTRKRSPVMIPDRWKPVSPADLTARVRPEANDLQLWKLLERRKIKVGLGEEALEQAGTVLHLPEPGLDQRGQLADVVLDPGWPGTV